MTTSRNCYYCLKPNGQVCSIGYCHRHDAQTTPSLPDLLASATSLGWTVTFHPPPINCTVTRSVYAGRSLGYVAAVGRAQGTDHIPTLTLALSRATSAADLLEVSLDTPSTLDIPHLLGLTKPAAIGIARRI